MTALSEQLAALKILPVITLERAEDILPLAEILTRHDLPVAEITFRTEAAAQAIHLLRRYRPAMLVGAGTVINRERARLAAEAGADFAVSAGFNPSTVRACREWQLPLIPGVNNPSAIEAALEQDLTVLKFFPAQASGGLAMLKALQGPFEQVQFVPTGGIDVKNLGEYLALPNVLACGGTWLVDPQLIRSGDWDALEQRVAGAVALVRPGRQD
ncbi:bifunctional 4-hydroxy-2-oxoglutarate aldolase/2-dehydro-3-deoxy-phosphogluconate aldolase [Oceanimonas doudoroffii]|uniref:2-dehydro-3-deoxyphosphogluconate aldolase n=1 Tax=Oceanimonas doudoroffii TaxID=84158 RepID=A0A233RHE3_9GAMM|nr:bifunctional 4-hydroxy-2-oxoglutarate aldolase/2-dehydro-3-deoxy-phosphogluconate aldolase [Oceanimonas doudoroffii]OXY82794.1 2-dehydro-3-deoxyphosphogluconate aldolase [Oceanimonas doudoroffii]